MAFQLGTENPQLDKEGTNLILEVSLTDSECYSKLFYREVASNLSINYSYLFWMISEGDAAYYYGGKGTERMPTFPSQT